jgi:hypothetical protein
MDAEDLLPHRTALIGTAVALALGVTGGLVLKTGSQTAPDTGAAYFAETPYERVEQIAWPTGKLPDYVVGTDFLKAQDAGPPPVVVAAYEVPEYTPATRTEPAPPPAPPVVQPVRMAQAEERYWPSTQGDILDTRLPEDARDAPEAPEAPEPPTAAAPIVLTAAYY